MLKMVLRQKFIIFCFTDYAYGLIMIMFIIAIVIIIFFVIFLLYLGIIKLLSIPINYVRCA